MQAETAIPAERVRKLERLGDAKRRSLAAAIWAAANRPEFAEQARAQKGCADELLLREVISGEFAGRCVVRGGVFCHQRCTCNFCAILDGAKYLRAYVPKVFALIAEYPRHQLYTAVLTVRVGPNLREQLDIVEAALGRLSQFLRDSRRRGGKAHGGFAVLLGGLLAVEVKWSQAEGGWHVHVHGIFLGPPRWSFAEAQEQWAGFTAGHGHRVKFAKLREFWKLERGLITREQFDQTLVKALCEVLKYPFKFEDSMPGLAWDVQAAIKGRRLRRPFGVFRGVKLPETVEDERGIPWDLVEWVEVFCKYQGGAYRSKVISNSKDAKNERT